MAVKSRPAKRSIDDLAAFGGARLFAEPFHVGRPTLPPFHAIEERLRRVFERKWLTNHGPEVVAFEQEIAARAGVRHAIAVCNATTALSVAARALGMAGEVIVPSFTFVATAHALAWQGITPVFCDIGRATHAIDPGQVERLITPQTTGILGVHIWGQTCDVDALQQIADRHRLRLLFDAAHAFGCSHRGAPIGGQGDATVFSFHATKFLNTFEGGAIATDDDALAERVRLMIDFGFAGHDRVVSIGINGKMSEASAAMGLASLEQIEDVIARNRGLHDLYRVELEGATGIRLLGYDDTERSNFQYVVTEVCEADAGLSRDVLLEVLWAENVLARRYFYPGVHLMEPYRSLYPCVGQRLPRTQQVAERVLVLPAGAAVTPADVPFICDLIRFCVSHGDQIAARLPQEKLVVAKDLRLLASQ